jgi:hypothetical protein
VTKNVIGGPPLDHPWTRSHLRGESVSNVDKTLYPVRTKNATLWYNPSKEAFAYPSPITRRICMGINWKNFTIKHFYGLVKIVTLLVAKLAISRGWIVAK